MAVTRRDTVPPLGVSCESSEKSCVSNFNFTVDTFRSK